MLKSVKDIVEEHYLAIFSELSSETYQESVPAGVSGSRIDFYKISRFKVLEFISEFIKDLEKNEPPEDYD